MFKYDFQRFFKSQEELQNAREPFMKVVTLPCQICGAISTRNTTTAYLYCGRGLCHTCLLYNKHKKRYTFYNID